jgi:hypothetical protein
MSRNETIKQQIKAGHFPLFSGIRLRFRGKAFVRWCETDQSGIGITRISSKQDFTATENYFDTTVMLTGNLLQIQFFEEIIHSDDLSILNTQM